MALSSVGNTTAGGTNPETTIKNIKNIKHRSIVDDKNTKGMMELTKILKQEIKSKLNIAKMSTEMKTDIKTKRRS